MAEFIKQDGSAKIAFAAALALQDPWTLFLTIDEQEDELLLCQNRGKNWVRFCDPQTVRAMIGALTELAEQWERDGKLTIPDQEGSNG